MTWFVCERCKIHFNVKITAQMRRLAERLNGGRVVPDCPNCLRNDKVRRARWKREVAKCKLCGGSIVPTGDSAESVFGYVCTKCGTDYWKGEDGEFYPGERPYGECEDPCL